MKCATATGFNLCQQT